MVNLTHNVLVLIQNYFILLSMHVVMDLQLELLCRHVLMVFDRNGPEEPGWHWKRIVLSKLSWVWVIYAADVIFSRMSALMSKGMPFPFLLWKRYLSMLMKGRGTYCK